MGKAMKKSGKPKKNGIRSRPRENNKVDRWTKSLLEWRLPEDKKTRTGNRRDR